MSDLTPAQKAAAMAKLVSEQAEAQEDLAATPTASHDYVDDPNGTDDNDQENTRYCRTHDYHEGPGDPPCPLPDRVRCTCEAGGTRCRLGRASRASRGSTRCEGCSMGLHKGHALAATPTASPVCDCKVAADPNAHSSWCSIHAATPAASPTEDFDD